MLLCNFAAVVCVSVCVCVGILCEWWYCTLSWFENLFLGVLHKVQSFAWLGKVFLKYFLVIKPRDIVNFTTNAVLRTHKVQKWRNTSMLWLTGLQNTLENYNPQFVFHLVMALYPPFHRVCFCCPKEHYI